MVKNFLLTAVLLFSGCALFPRAPLPVAPEIPATGAPVGVEAHFAPAGGPVDGKLYVCGLIESVKFWCIDYDTFQESMAAYDEPRKTAGL